MNEEQKSCKATKLYGRIKFLFEVLNAFLEKNPYKLVSLQENLKEGELLA